MRVLFVINLHDSSDVKWFSWNLPMKPLRPMRVRNSTKEASIASPPSPGTGVCAAEDAVDMYDMSKRDWSM